MVYTLLVINLSLLLSSPRNVHPGYSMFEWNVLCQSGQDLSGVGGKLRRVTLEELERHSTEGDVWTAVRGSWWVSFPYKGRWSKYYVIRLVGWFLQLPFSFFGFVTLFFHNLSGTWLSYVLG